MKTPPSIESTRLKHSFSRAVKFTVFVGIAVVTILTSCGPRTSTTTPMTTTQTTTQTTPTITTPQYDSVFQGYITQMRANGEAALADTLVSLYKTEPAAARSIGYLQKEHPDLAELLVSQPWFKDGLNDSERAALEYGLGEQGLGGGTGIDDVLRDIIVNQQWVVDKVQLSGGIKYIVAIYDRPDAASKENATTIVDIVKVASPVIEKLNGAKYPLDAITMFPNYITAPGDSGAGNGFIDLGLYPEGINRNLVETLLEEDSHVIINSRIGGIIYTREWITEGFANFSKAYAGEKLSQSNIPWWNSSWNYTMQQVYDGDLSYMKRLGIWGLPLSGSDLDKKSHTEKVYMGSLFMTDLYRTLGENNYTTMMSGIYDWQTANPKVVVDENKLEDFALKSSPNDAVKANVQKLFDTRVWGTAQ